MAKHFKPAVRRAINRLLQPLGLHLVRRERAFEMESLLARAAIHQSKVATWIDVGASDGSWSLLARQHFPQAEFLLFEPLAERQPVLDKLRAKHGFEIAPAAAGATAGRTEFTIDPKLDGSGVAAPGAASTRSVPIETIDQVVAARRLPGPFGIKLDTHGYEVPVLSGATSVLSQTNLLIIEAYNFTLMPGCLRFHELCAWLEERNFRCCDLADPMRRPHDGALWQMDLAFAPISHPMFASDRYE